MSNGQGTFRHRRRYPYSPKATLCLALLAAIPGNSGAFDVDYEIGLAAKRSDNINLSETNPISETVLSPRLNFEAEQTGRTVQLSARGDLEYLHYIDGTFDNETRGRFAGKLNWTVLPQRLDFVLQDYLSLQPVDQLAAFSPGNQQQINVFVAGPTLHARFDGTTRGQLDLRYINSYAEKNTAFDSDRYHAAARLSHDLSANNRVSANLEATDVRFDLAGRASDYRRYEGYANSTIKRKRIDLSVDLGTSRLEFDRRDSKSYPLARATLDWRISSRSRLETTVRYQLGDAAQGLISPLDLNLDIDLDRRNFNDLRTDAIVEPNVYRERMIRLRYVYKGERLNLRVAPYSRQIRYVEDLVASQDRRGGIVNVDYRLRPRLTLTLRAAKEDRDYLGISRKDQQMVTSVGLANRFTRHWTGQIDFQRRQRDSTAVGRSHDENAVMVSFSYQR